MAVSLEIRDGDPWWLSPDLWTVPGDNPEGSEGMPIAGEPCYVWARVTNNGTTLVNNATVRFYWANPSVGFDRTTANDIGISYVTLDTGETKDVLCLTPWVPVFVNEGHECILAEAFQSALDPLPATTDFNVPTDRHVAQRNIAVALAIGGMFKLAFEVHNTERNARKFQLKAHQDKLGQIEPLTRHFGRHFKIPYEEGKVGKFGFVHAPCPDEDALKDAVPVVDVEVGPSRRVGLSLIGMVEGGALLIHIEQLLDNRIVGGLSVIVLQKSNIDEYKGGKKI